MKKALGYFLIAALTIITFRLLVACAPQAPELQPFPYMVRYVDSLPVFGATGCDTLLNVPVVNFRTGIIHTESEEPIIAHEMTHVRQIVSYPGGCKSYISRYRKDETFRVNTEVEAYCVQLVVAERQSVSFSYNIFLLSVTEHVATEYPAQAERIRVEMPKKCAEIRQIFQKR